MGEGRGSICYSFLLFLHCGGGGFPSSVVLPIPIQDVACRGLAGKEWNHGVGCGVEVAPVIGQYFVLGCFSTVRWPGQHCHCPRNPGGLCFHSLSSLRFSLRALLCHWIGDATEDSLCLTHHVLRNSWNMFEVKVGPPLVLSSSGAPYVWNSCRQMDVNLDVVASPGSS